MALVGVLARYLGLDGDDDRRLAMFARGVAEAAVFCAVVMVAQRFLDVGAAWAWLLAVVMAVLTTRVVALARTRRLDPPPG